MKKAAKPMRSQQEIFDELAELCVSPGYVHAIAYLCFRDNMMCYLGEMMAKDMQHLFSKSRLIRTETSTLIGLMLKRDIDYTLSAPKTLDNYVKTTEALLEEIHHNMLAAFWGGIDPTKIADREFNPFTSGTVLREPIFYGGESAYNFQYRDFSLAKYGRDDNWLVANKGFSILDARNVVYAISRLQDEKAVETLQSMRKAAPEEWTLLPGITFAIQEVADRARMDPAVVERVLMAFAAPAGACNEQFTALHDFNIINACPLIPTPDGAYVLFHIYSLVEALYEAPFYWMGADKAYASTAMKHRGLFTEHFAVERLTQVFGADNVLSNIDIFESKGKKLGEIDVLVLFGDRALVLQAKSKRLTLEARRGNDLQIRDDFKKSIQDSSDQAYLAVVRSLLRMARDEWQWIDSFPKVRMLGGEVERDRWLTREEADRLIQACPDHLVALVKFALATGCRAREITGLEWERVDLDRQTAWLNQTKNGTPRGVPLNKDALEVLKAQQGKHKQFCFAFKGKPIRWQVSDKIWRRAVKEAGITDLRFHDLRHTWASWHRQAGTSCDELKDLGGWKTRSMVDRYAKFATEHLAVAAARIETLGSARPGGDGGNVVSFPTFFLRHQKQRAWPRG